MQPSAPRVGRGWNIFWRPQEIFAGNPRQPFVVLRNVGIQTREFLLQELRDVNRDVGLKGGGFSEMIPHIEVNGVRSQRSHVGADPGDHDEIRRILYQRGCVAMIGVVVARAVGDYDIGLCLPQQADYVSSCFESRQQVPICVGQDVISGETQASGGFIAFEAAARCHGRAIVRLVTGTSVGHRNEVHFVSCRSQQCCCATALGFAIVGVRPDEDDVHEGILPGENVC